MSELHNYDWMRKEFMEAIRACISGKDIGLVEKLYVSLNEPDTEKRSALDQGFRDYLLLLLGSPQDMAVYETFLSRCLEVSRKEMASVGMPVILLGDIFDCLTLDKCELLFGFVESNVSVWKQELFFTPCKNNLLRLCNDLLRRLSRSQNTVFCGRILLFLAKFFPFSERSGLNVVSEFNLENITEFSGDDSIDTKENDEKMDDSTADEGADKTKIDYNLYTKFWALQNFFRNPLLVYNKVQFKTFASHAENVLSAFKSLKLEGVQSNKPSLAAMSGDEMETDQVIASEHYFAKFLTNQKLLELQLSDVNFRRYVLVQFLILFQYLNATVKFKNENQELKVVESEWVQDTTARVYSLLRETPPDGETFAKTVQHILAREEYWNNWKNEGCPELQKPNPPVEDISEEDKRPIQLRKRPKRRLGQMIKEATAQKKFYLGNSELNKLWNYNVDNLDSCRASERNFLTSPEEYFKDAIEQLDPAAMVEDQYKVVNDENFGWRALRLLALQSSHFFTHSNNPIFKQPEYLEFMIKKIAKERPIILPNGEAKSGESQVMSTGNEGEAENEAEAEEDLLNNRDEKRDEIINSEEMTEAPETTQKPPLIGPEVLDTAARIINIQWKTLAEKRGFTDSIQYIEESLKSDMERARYILQLWVEEETEITKEHLIKTLETSGFPGAALAIRNLP